MFAEILLILLVIISIAELFFLTQIRRKAAQVEEKINSIPSDRINKLANIVNQLDFDRLVKIEEGLPETTSVIIDKLEHFCLPQQKCINVPFVGQVCSPTISPCH